MARLTAAPLPAPAGQREVHLASGSQRRPVYARDTRCAGTRFNGPAIVTQLDTTTLVPPGWGAEVHPSASLLPRRV